MKKSELRTLFLERRGSLSPEEVAEASRRISDSFFESVNLVGINCIQCFIRIDKFHEIDTIQILQRLWKEHPGVMTAAPRVNFSIGEIENVAFGPDGKLIESKWGIKEPAGPLIEEGAIDLVLVPLLCFDERGFRVGYGGGYYDRFLSRCRPDCRKIGLSIFEPIKKIEEVAEHDVALDLFITPNGLFQPNRK
jgi:5-formyltetrahydrofolate cyclo-ligase